MKLKILHEKRDPFFIFGSVIISYSRTEICHWVHRLFLTNIINLQFVKLWYAIVLLHKTVSVFNPWKDGIIRSLYSPFYCTIKHMKYLFVLSIVDNWILRYFSNFAKASLLASEITFVFYNYTTTSMFIDEAKNTLKKLVFFYSNNNHKLCNRYQNVPFKFLFSFINYQLGDLILIIQNFVTQNTFLLFKLHA